MVILGDLQSLCALATAPFICSERRLRLAELLIHFRGINLGQQLARPSPGR